MDTERKGLQVIIGLFFFIGITLAGVADRFKSCKCTDESLCWPSPREWREFNASIDGALLSPLPPSYQCHIPYYNATECARVAQVYENRYWREDHPVAMQQPHTELDVVTNKGCIGVDNKYSFCHLRGNLPNYVVNVTTLEQIQKALKFATDNNLRLTVKNTGHDFQGRSTAKGGLSIWLHHLRNVEFVDSYEPAGCSECSGQSAVILGPGVQLGPVMQAANARGLVVASGSCPSIGLAGGWIQGGGHGMLGPSIGMGVDTVLQYKVITADGKIRIANKCQNRDLFWALRGGGGGTYAVVVETVLKTYPSPAIVGAIISFQANSTESFRGLIRRYVEEMPRWSDKGWAGYFYVIASRTLRFVCMNPTSNVTYAQSTLAPFISYVTSTPGLSYSTQLFSAFPSFYPFWRTVSASHDNTIYGNMVLGSWLVPRANHEGEENIERLADGYLDIVAQNQNGYAFVMMVAGGAVSTKAGCETSLLPAWRTALTHSVVTANMPYNVTLAQRTEIESSITAQVQILRDLAPESGAYTNEADANEPDWQRAFFGEHYDQLLEIKKLYDPNELFLCPRCVGSEGRTKDLNCKL